MAKISTMKQRAIRLPDELWDGIGQAAEADYSTRNSWCARALRDAVLQTAPSPPAAGGLRTGRILLQDLSQETS